MNLTLEAWLQTEPDCADGILWRCLIQAFMDRGWAVELIGPPPGGRAYAESPCFKAEREGVQWEVLAWAAGDLRHYEHRPPAGLGGGTTTAGPVVWGVLVALLYYHTHLAGGKKG